MGLSVSSRSVDTTDSGSHPQVLQGPRTEKRSPKNTSRATKALFLIAQLALQIMGRVSLTSIPVRLPGTSALKIIGMPEERVSDYNVTSWCAPEVIEIEPNLAVLAWIARGRFGGSNSVPVAKLIVEGRPYGTEELLTLDPPSFSYRSVKLCRFRPLGAPPGFVALWLESQKIKLQRYEVVGKTINRVGNSFLLTSSANPNGALSCSEFPQGTLQTLYHYYRFTTTPPPPAGHIELFRQGLSFSGQNFSIDGNSTCLECGQPMDFPSVTTFSTLQDPKRLIVLSAGFSYLGLRGVRPMVFDENLQMISNLTGFITPASSSLQAALHNEILLVTATSLSGDPAGASFNSINITTGASLGSQLLFANTVTQVIYRSLISATPFGFTRWFQFGGNFQGQFLSPAGTPLTNEIQGNCVTDSLSIVIPRWDIAVLSFSSGTTLFYRDTKGIISRRLLYLDSMNLTEVTFIDNCNNAFSFPPTPAPTIEPTTALMQGSTPSSSSPSSVGGDTGMGQQNGKVEDNSLTTLLLLGFGAAGCYGLFIGLSICVALSRKKIVEVDMLQSNTEGGLQNVELTSLVGKIPDDHSDRRANYDLHALSSIKDDTAYLELPLPADTTSQGPQNPYDNASGALARKGAHTEYEPANSRLGDGSSKKSSGRGGSKGVMSSVSTKKSAQSENVEMELVTILFSPLQGDTSQYDDLPLTEAPKPSATSHYDEPPLGSKQKEKLEAEQDGAVTTSEVASEGSHSDNLHSLDATPPSEGETP